MTCCKKWMKLTNENVSDVYRIKTDGKVSEWRWGQEGFDIEELKFKYCPYCKSELK